MHPRIPLLVASSSKSRRQLLQQMAIPFEIIAHTADESSVSLDRPLAEAVTLIAQMKMAHTIIADYAHERAFVLTADTLSADKNGILHTKPINKEDAIKKIKALRGTSHVATSFCLERRVKKNNQWHTEQQLQKLVTASCTIDIPDAWIEQYLTTVPESLQASGALTIEGFGAQFIKTINGSYTTIIGLPLFELRIALEAMGFYTAR